MRSALCEASKSGLALFLAFTLVVTLTPPPMMAQDGGTVKNGSNTTAPFAPAGTVVNGFLFEPEVPLSSLKGVPTWNEIEQLLDNPYAVALCSTLPTAPPLVQNTPPTENGFPSFCTTTVTRRPSFGGVALPPLLVDGLNYNPTTGEYMRILNPNYPGGSWVVPDQLVQNGTSTTYYQTYKRIDVTAGSDRIGIDPVTGRPEHEIDYNSPITADFALPNVVVPLLPLFNPFPNILIGLETCIAQTEAAPPEGSTLCGGDTGEPGLNLARPRQYSNLATANANVLTNKSTPGNLLQPGGSAVIQARNFPSGANGLKKPSLTIPPFGSQAVPGYAVNTVNSDVAPSNENDYFRCDDRAAGNGPANLTSIGNCNFANKQQARLDAMVLGKALFWDMQVGSDGVQSCGTCHFHAGADNRTKNQLNPNHLGNEGFSAVIDVNGHSGGNADLTVADFPFQKLADPNIAGDPKCVSPITASINPGVLENNFPGGVTGLVVCDAGNVISSSNDVASSMGVHFGIFGDIATPGTFQATGAGVNAIAPDVRSTTVPNIDPLADFRGTDGSNNQFRRVEPRNTPTIFQANLNFDNFWDGRARHDFNGGSVFGAADPQNHVFVTSTSTSPLTATRQIIRFASLASLATGPGLSEFEMSFQGRNWSKVGKKLLQDGVTPLANQLVATDDSLLGRYSNQGGTACTAVPVADRAPGSPAAGKPGLCITYRGLIHRAFHPALWQNTAQHLNGCYTDAANHTDHLCAAGTTADPFDGFVLTPAAGGATPADTYQFTQMEGNFSLFWGLSVNAWVSLLVPDDTPFDRFLDANPDAFAAMGEPGEAGIVQDLPNCTTATQRDCFRAVGNFQRDTNHGGTLNASDVSKPDPLLGLDLFFSSNLSLKNPNFRSARCGECHAPPTLTDNTMPFTFKAQLRDFLGEFNAPGIENSIEPLGRNRMISGFLLESEFNENGQDGVERRIANQSIVPNPSDGFAYPDGLFNPDGTAIGNTPGQPILGTIAGDNRYAGAGQSFFDNGVYNLGVTRCEADQTHVTGACDDVGRGGNDAFGWPLSLAALLLKDLGGPTQEPGQPLATFDSTLGPLGGLFEETSQDQQINPGVEGGPVASQLPGYLAPWVNQINVGDSQPELDEVFGGVNTLTDVAMLEGFIDTLGPNNPAATQNEAYNMGDSAIMGTWPIVNKVGRFGSFKAAQLREVELTGPYFHNGGKLTLRQVVDFYSRGGDFPVTNATHRDFNIINQNIEVQSNLSEAEKVALVDFLLELTDDRVAYERAPFDHPQVIVPLDGTAPDNPGRDVMLANCSATTVATNLVPNGGRECIINGVGAFLDVPAVGAGGSTTVGGTNTTVRQPNFLNIAGRGSDGLPIKRLIGGAASCSTADSQYCH
jgi:cytochrome c peroxidase